MSDRLRHHAILNNIPMLRRQTYLGRRPPRDSPKAQKEGWNAAALASRTPCPDCDGWISLHYEHNPTCPRLDYLKGRARE